MSALSFLLPLLLLAQITSRDQIPPAIRADIESLIGAPTEARLDRLETYDEQYKAELRKWGRIWVETRPSYEPLTVHHIFLFDLGDEKAFEQEINEELYGDGNRMVLIYSRNPKVVPALAPTMFRDDLLKVEQIRRTLNPPLPYAVAGTIICLLQLSPQFSPEVRHWALSSAAFGDYDQELAIMREWWRENEVYFKAGDYAAVRPGRTAATLVAASPAAALSAPAPAETSVPASSTPPPTAASPTATSAGSSASLWTGAALALTVLVGLLLLRLRRSRSGKYS